MSREVTRRDVLAAMSLSVLAPRLWAAAANVRICLSMTYMAKQDVKFNSDRFRSDHVPLMKQVYGDALERVVLRTPPRKRPGEDPPPMPSPVLASITLWIRDMDAFAAGSQKGGQEIVADLAKVTNGVPIVQFDELLAEHGEPSESLFVGNPVVSLFYPGSEGAKWDGAYYTKTYLPLMAETYGPAALKRVEVYQGIAGPASGKPLIVSAVHMYINKQAAWDSAGRTAGQKLMAEAPKFTTIVPQFANMRVQAIG